MIPRPNVSGRRSGGSEITVQNFTLIIITQYFQCLWKLKLPLTLSSTVPYLVPALFFAVHVYFPPCLWPTLGMNKILPRPPNDVVIIPRSVEMLFPWNVHDTVIGSSPLAARQDTCATSFSFKISLPNDRGNRSGGSESKENYLLPIFLNTSYLVTILIPTLLSQLFPPTVFLRMLINYVVFLFV